VDSMGMLLAVLVTSAAMDDAAAAKNLMAMVDSEGFPRLRTIYVAVHACGLGLFSFPRIG
jgi:hypothetical protein